MKNNLWNLIQLLSLFIAMELFTPVTANVRAGKANSTGNERTTTGTLISQACFTI